MTQADQSPRRSGAKHVRPDTLGPHERKLVMEVLTAYAHGWFPMADPAGGDIDWYSPDPRAVLPLDSFHASRSLLRRVRSGRFLVTCDRAFTRVMRECAGPRLRRGRPDRSGSWISPEIIEAYTMLHKAGFAHSIEAWLAPGASPAGSRHRTAGANTVKTGGCPALVGGIYGVAFGAAFFGESMFSRPERGGTDASKVCLVHLVHHLRRRGYLLFDAQIANPHTAQFGCVEIPKPEYLRRLREAIEKAPFDGWGTFDPSRTIDDLHALPD